MPLAGAEPVVGADGMGGIPVIPGVAGDAKGLEEGDAGALGAAEGVPAPGEGFQPWVGALGATGLVGADNDGCDGMDESGGAWMPPKDEGGLAGADCGVETVPIMARGSDPAVDSPVTGPIAMEGEGEAYRPPEAA